MRDVPRVRGDEPDRNAGSSAIDVDVPRVRGDEPVPVHRGRRDAVFPACAGMNRTALVYSTHAGRHVPRVRGDEPRMVIGV